MVLVPVGTVLTYNDIQILRGALGEGLSYDETTGVISVNQNIQDGLISGGIVVWLHDYVYNVSPAVYAISGTVYSSPSTDITLDPADPTNDRIDIFVLTTSSTAIAITGTPSSPPVEPSYDADTQLLIAFATVDANTTEPTTQNDWIYKENTEWTTAVSSGTINPNSTNNPYAGTKDVEGTAVPNNAYITFTSPVTPNMGLYQNLTFAIRSKANWGKNKKWIIRFYNGTTAIGLPANLGSGSYGFVSTVTSQYQIITIPLSDFGDISAATVLRITQSNASGTIGWYLDNVQLQGGQGGGTQTVTLVGDATGTGTNTIPVTVTGIRGKDIPALSAGILRYNGTIWVFDATAFVQVIDVTVPVSGNTLTVAQLSGKTFTSCIQADQSFNSEKIIQTGTSLNFAAVGGVTAGQIITIYFK